MAAPSVNLERAASILVDAAYLGDPKAAERWHVTTRTIRNYRTLLKTDPELSALFRLKRAAAEGNWTSELNRALGSVIRKVALIADNIDPDQLLSTSDTLEALASAAKTLGEIAIAREVLNAGDGQPRPHNATPSASLAHDASTTN